MRERSAETAQNKGTFAEVPAGSCEARSPSRRSTVAIFGTTIALGHRIGGVGIPYPFRGPGRVTAALHPATYSHSRQAPSSGTVDGGTPWDVGHVCHRLQGATPCSISQASLVDALNEQRQGRVYRIDENKSRTNCLGSRQPRIRLRKCAIPSGSIMEPEGLVGRVQGSQ